MKKSAIAMAIGICASIFCLALQQSASAALQVSRGSVPGDLADSDAFLQNVTRAPKPLRDNAQRVESVLTRMTLEEKIGQMTQLEVGMVTSGKDQDIQIDPV